MWTHQDRSIPQPGLVSDAYLQIESALTQDATVRFDIPANSLIAYAGGPFTVDIKAKSKASAKTIEHILALGHETVPVNYHITLADGTEFSFTKPLHVTNRGFDGAYSGEHDRIRYIQNGPWSINQNKNYNHVFPERVGGSAWGNFDFPKLGKPYDDEFNLSKPTVNMYQDSMNMVMEVEYVSEKFPGFIVTQIFTLTPYGIMSRKSRVTNTHSMAQSIWLYDGYSLPLGDRAMFMYNGRLTANINAPIPDGVPWGFDDTDPAKIGENWVFDEDPTRPSGAYWPPDASANFTYGNGLYFEYDTGVLQPGQSFETGEVVFVYGLFNTCLAFRNYVRQMNCEEPEIPAYPVDVAVNSNNPFILADQDEMRLAVINNRNTILEGEVTAASPDGLFESQSQINPSEVITKGNTFQLPIAKIDNCMALVTLQMLLAQYEKSYTRALFFPRGEVVRSQEDGVLAINNGCMTFKVAPAYYDAVYSLVTHKPNGDCEWLASCYPNHEPHAGFNPFIGGIQPRLPNMDTVSVLREPVSADFVRVSDNFNNLWHGIRTTRTIVEHDPLKGAVYESYFLTLPGLPMLCHFIRFTNGTGIYQGNWLTTEIFAQPAEKLKDISAKFSDEFKNHFHWRMGTAGQGSDFENTLKLMGNREEHMYIFHNTKHKGSPRNGYIYGDNDFVSVDIGSSAPAAPGATQTTRPAFILISDRDVPTEAFIDLERVTFFENH